MPHSASTIIRAHNRTSSSHPADVAAPPAFANIIGLLGIRFLCPPSRLAPQGIELVAESLKVW
jgi:hypothetical protein